MMISNNRFSSVTALAVTLTLSALCTAPAAQGDTIVRVNGKRDRGVEVTATSATEITFKKGKSEATAAAPEVARIDWGGAPPTFGQAIGAQQKGEAKNAANLFKEASESATREVLKQEAQYRAAAALLSGAESDSSLAGMAVAEFDAYLGANPDGFRAPDAMLGKGRASRLADDANSAIATLTALEAAVTSKNWAPKWTALARLERGRALLLNKQNDDARSAFQGATSAADSVLNSGVNLPELKAVKGDSVIAQGETYVAAKQFGEALSFFRRYSGSDDQPILQSAALAGEGEVLLQQARSNSDDPALLRQAQMALARASVAAVSPTTSAKAMFLSAQVLKALGDKAKDSKVRASAYLRSVVRHYRGTAWAKRAQAELDG